MSVGHHRAAYGKSPIFIFCDHASNAVPSEFDDLGLPTDLLSTHIAYDIGARAVAEATARLLEARFFACAFSRLIIDVNRAPEAHDVIPAIADAIPVPGNAHLSEDEREDRFARFHTPYHEALDAAIEEEIDAHRSPFIVSIHSFTDRLMGATGKRPWPIGLLWRQDERSARAFIGAVEPHLEGPIGDNQPYDARIFNYSIDRHVGPRALRHLTIELRQDLIGRNEGAARMSALLARAIEAVLKSG